MKSKIAAGALALTIPIGIGYLLIEEHKKTTQIAVQTVALPVTHETATSAIEEKQAAAEPGAPGAPAQQREKKAQAADKDSSIYRCQIGGKTTYQDQPCAAGQQVSVDGGNLSVVPKFPTDRRAVTQTERRVTATKIAKADAEHMQCPELRQRLRYIDAQARQKSTERLTQQRRDVLKRMSDLKCSRMERR